MSSLLLFTNSFCTGHTLQWKLCGLPQWSKFLHSLPRRLRAQHSFSMRLHTTQQLCHLQCQPYLLRELHANFPLPKRDLPQRYFRMLGIQGPKLFEMRFREESYERGMHWDAKLCGLQWISMRILWKRVLSEPKHLLQYRSTVLED